MPDPWAVVSHQPVQAQAADPWAVKGVKAPPKPEEGFWRSAGAQIAGLFSGGGPGAIPDPAAAASIGNTMVTAAQQYAHPLDPNTGLPIYITPEMRNLHLAAALTAPVGGQSVEKMLEQTEAGNFRGAAGTAVGAAAPIVAFHKLGQMANAPVKPATNPTEALATFVDSRAGAVDPHAIASDLQPVLQKQAAADGLDLSKLEGRDAGQAVMKTVDNAVKSHNAQVAQISQPFGKVMVDQTPIAEAYLRQRTPELIRNDPEAAARLMSEARKFADVDNSGQIIGAKPAPLADVNSLRVRLNNETAALQSKAEGAFRKSAWESKADVEAVKAAREVQYSNLARLSGQSEAAIRALQRTEGQLMEFRDSFTKQFNDASAAHAEHVAQSLKANPPGSGRFSVAAREKIGHTYPSRHGVERSTIREVMAPSPLEVFNNHLKLAFSGKAGGAGVAAQPAVPQPGTTLGPGAPSIGGGTTRSININGQPAGYVKYSVNGDTLTIDRMDTHAGMQAEFQRARGETPTSEGRLEQSQLRDIAQQLQRDHPDVKNIEFVRAGGLRAAEGRTVRIPMERAVRMPANRAQSPSGAPATLQPPQGSSPQQSAAFWMLAAKRGEVSPAEADRRIQRLVGSKGRQTKLMAPTQQ